MHLSNPGFQAKFSTLSFVLMLAVLWLALHGYHGFTEDGQIYAFQAFAKLHPQLAADLYLKNTSQDQFTLFSPLYACFIELLGLNDAARLLTLVFTVWFLAAAWSFVRIVTTGREAAWLAAALLLTISGAFGSSGVFRILDPFLTARLPAEALIITALACHVRGMKRLGLLLALGALFIHPLMALPGVLMIAFLWVPARVGLTGAVGGLFATAAIAVVALHLPTDSHALIVMDAPWLDVVRERSQFLFLQLWSLHDWNTNVQPFISLGLTAVAVADDRIRKLCAAAALVGGAGLGVAFIAGLIGPIAILVQGQAWRWVWIAVFIGAGLVPITVLKVWRVEPCGPLCALLLVLGWTLPSTDGTACLLIALLFWLNRARISSRLTIYFRWAAVVLAGALMVWTLMRFPAVVSFLAPSPGRAPLSAARIGEIFTLEVAALLLGMTVWWGAQTSRKAWVPMLLSVMLAASSVLLFPAAFAQSRTLAAAADIREFADWKSIVPPASTILVTPPRDVGAFVWFTMARPNYLTLNQSSGVVFSRTTALEVRRRSNVLLPLMDPDWKILTGLRSRSIGARKSESTIRPLTSESLIEVCADPLLGFVISPENVGFAPLRHDYPGAWENWNLYDCRKVRSSQSPS
jgi:hypothetical protein